MGLLLIINGRPGDCTLRRMPAKVLGSNPSRATFLLTLFAIRRMMEPLQSCFYLFEFEPHG